MATSQPKVDTRCPKCGAIVIYNTELSRHECNRRFNCGWHIEMPVCDEAEGNDFVKEGASVATADKTPKRDYRVWFCKIGIQGDCALPNGADSPMRRAVQKAFFDVTGLDDQFCFSGWGGTLDEGERFVVEYEELPAKVKPSPEKTEYFGKPTNDAEFADIYMSIRAQREAKDAVNARHIEPELPGIESTLAERERTYGNFARQAAAMIHIKRVLLNSPDSAIETPADCQQSIEMIVVKLVRLMSSPTHIDSWRDIEGYAKLVRDRLERDERNRDATGPYPYDQVR